jgi:hypothetical protein
MHPTNAYQNQSCVHLVVAPQIQSCMSLIHPRHYEFRGISVARQVSCRQIPCIYHVAKCPLIELKDALQENQSTKTSSHNPNASWKLVVQVPS